MECSLLVWGGSYYKKFDSKTYLQISTCVTILQLFAHYLVVVVFSSVCVLIIVAKVLLRLEFIVTLQHLDHHRVIWDQRVNTSPALPRPDSHFFPFMLPWRIYQLALKKIYKTELCHLSHAMKIQPTVVVKCFLEVFIIHDRRLQGGGFPDTCVRPFLCQDNHSVLNASAVTWRHTWQTMSRRQRSRWEMCTLLSRVLGLIASRHICSMKIWDEMFLERHI